MCTYVQTHTNTHTIIFCEDMRRKKMSHIRWNGRKWKIKEHKTKFFPLASVVIAFFSPFFFPHMCASCYSIYVCRNEKAFNYMWQQHVLINSNNEICFFWRNFLFAIFSLFFLPFLFIPSVKDKLRLISKRKLEKWENLLWWFFFFFHFFLFFTVFFLSFKFG